VPIHANHQFALITSVSWSIFSYNFKWLICNDFEFLNSTILNQLESSKAAVNCISVAIASPRHELSIFYMQVYSDYTAFCMCMQNINRHTRRQHIFNNLIKGKDYRICTIPEFRLEHVCINLKIVVMGMSRYICATKYKVAIICRNRVCSITVSLCTNQCNIAFNIDVTVIEA